MNCREAQQQIFAERDGALNDARRAGLTEHVTRCAGCRRIRESLTAVVGAWRSQVASATIPNAEREWHAVRRRIRGGVEAGAERVQRPRRNVLSWFAVPLTAVAAAAMAVLIAPRTSDSSGAAAQVAEVGRAHSVEVPGGKVSTMIYVDDKSGWLFVWASDPNPQPG